MISQKKFINHLSKPLSNKHFVLFFKYMYIAYEYRYLRVSVQVNERSLLGGIYKSFTYTKTRSQNFLCALFCSKD